VIRSIATVRLPAVAKPTALFAGLGDELLELRVDGDTAVALAALGAHGIAGRSSARSATPSCARSHRFAQRETRQPMRRARSPESAAVHRKE